MDSVGNLEAAAAAGRIGVSDAATRMARAMTGPESSRGFEGPMKEAVRKELFTEALLGAAHARFEELKSAAGER
jgi:class 3 adenylate cyclase